MRRIERVFGVPAGILGIAALIVTVTQHAIIAHSGSAVLVLSSATVTADRLAIAIPVGLAALGATCVALGAVQGTRRGMSRGLWTTLVVVGAAVCVLGVYLLSANNVWVNVGGSPTDPHGVVAGPGIFRVSAAFLFAPAALMGIVAAAVLAALGTLLPRGHAAALG